MMPTTANLSQSCRLGIGVKSFSERNITRSQLLPFGRRAALPPARRTLQLQPRYPTLIARCPTTNTRDLRGHASAVEWTEKVSTSAAEVGSEGDPNDFVWTRCWWPLIPEAYLKADRPNPITLLGMPLVVWRDTGGVWRVFRDRCPHRLAPLSEGRVEADGSLSCSYHGWRFDGSGACRRIPQAVDAAAEAAACNSRRACATAYPARLEMGMLWVWPDDAPDAVASAAAAPVMINYFLRQRHERYQEYVQNKAVLPPGQAPPTAVEWYMRDLPYSYEILLENLTDPAHLPFSHHGISPRLLRDKGVGMPMKPSKGAAAAAAPGDHAAAVVPRPLHWARPEGPDFEYDFVGNVAPDGTVSVHMPYNIVYTYRVGKMEIYTELFALPVAPGRSRFLYTNQGMPRPRIPPFLKFLTDPKQAFKDVLSIYDPIVFSHHLGMNEILDGDSVFLSVQDELVHQAQADMAATSVTSSALERTGAAAHVDPAASHSALAASKAGDGGTTDGPAAAASSPSTSTSSSMSFWSRLYFIPSQADNAVLAARRWLEEHGGGGPFQARQRQLLQRSGAAGSPAATLVGRLTGSSVVPGEAPDPAGRIRRLDRYEQHTRHCPFCSSRLQNLQRLIAAAKVVQKLCLMAMCVAGGALGAAVMMATGGAAVTVSWVPPAAGMIGLATVWAVARWLMQVVEGVTKNFLYKDYVHAEKN